MADQPVLPAELVRSGCVLCGVTWEDECVPGCPSWLREPVPRYGQGPSTAEATHKAVPGLSPEPTSARPANPTQAAPRLSSGGRA